MEWLFDKAIWTLARLYTCSLPGSHTVVSCIFLDLLQWFLLFCIVSLMTFWLVILWNIFSWYNSVLYFVYQAVEEEKALYERATMRQVYLNLCINSIKKLRDLSSIECSALATGLAVPAVEADRTNTSTNTAMTTTVTTTTTKVIANQTALSQCGNDELTGKKLASTD